MGESIGRALIATLHAAGVKLKLDDGELMIGGTAKALAVWTALASTIEGLDGTVLAALTEATLEAADGGNGDAPAAVPATAEVIPLRVPPTLPPPPPPVPRLPPPPRTDSGIPYLDARGLAWRARWDRARCFGTPFTEEPPYDMSAFGGW